MGRVPSPAEQPAEPWVEEDPSGKQYPPWQVVPLPQAVPLEHPVTHIPLEEPDMAAQIPDAQVEPTSQEAPMALPLDAEVPLVAAEPPSASPESAPAGDGPPPPLLPLDV